MDEIAIQQDATGTTEEQQGATAPDEGQQQTAVLSPREAAMAAIEEQIARQREDQGVTEDQTAAPEATTDDRQQGQQAVSAPADPPRQAERMLTVKVDGIEMQLPESEVIKGYQKDQAASRRLEEAAQRLKEIEERERALQAQDPATQAPAAKAGESQNQPHQVDDPAELARRIVDGIVEGQVDDAVSMLAEALKQSAKTPDATPVVDASQVAEIVKQQLTATELEADYQRAKQLFDQDYADINQSPRLAQMCNAIYFEHLDAGKKPSEAARLAGDEVRTLIAPSPQQSTTTRQERKRSIDTINPAAAHVAAPGQDATSNDPNAVIAEMKRARGQT